MASAEEKLIEVLWATHSDPTKVGKKEKLRPREARAAVRTGLATFVDDKDIPPAKPSMNTREEALKADAEQKAGGAETAPPAPSEVAGAVTAAPAASPAPEQPDTDADDAAALDAAVASADNAMPVAKAGRPSGRK